MRGGAHPSLTPSERAVVERSLGVERRELALLELRAAVVADAADARRRALAVAGGRAFPLRTRLKAALTAVAPRKAGRIVRRRRAGRWTGASGIEITSAPADAVPSEREAAPR